MLHRSLILFIGIVVGFVVAVAVFWGFKYRGVRDEDGEKVGFWRRGIVARRIAHEEEKRRAENADSGDEGRTDTPQG